MTHPTNEVLPIEVQRVLLDFIEAWPKYLDVVSAAVDAVGDDLPALTYHRDQINWVQGCVEDWAQILLTYDTNDPCWAQILLTYDTNDPWFVENPDWVLEAAEGMRDALDESVSEIGAFMSVFFEHDEAQAELVTDTDARIVTYVMGDEVNF